ncbi:MAG: magnesium transporter [Armatimonadetes bacterium]|nr:magnesium transporter [Armatimonadota bacterium]
MSDTPPEMTASDLRDEWRALSADERREAFVRMPLGEAEDLYEGLDPAEQAELLQDLPRALRQVWFRSLAPDDAADVVQQLDEPEHREALLELLEPPVRAEVSVLLEYEEDEAGGLMSPRYARLRPHLRVDEAIAYLRRQARQDVETFYYAYVVDGQGLLLGVVSFRDLFTARPDQRVREVMEEDLITVPEELDQEALSHLFREHDLVAIPVVDEADRMVGIVTVDDIVDVFEEEATEDIQKMGGSEALDAPYLQVPLLTIVRKRAIWLMVLFIGEMLTATAMSRYEEEIARAVVLALFIPLIISSGGNTGSQATTLIIRAMAIGEVRMRDWWRVFGREVFTGLMLGLLLGALGFLRVVLWPNHATLYGPHYVLVGTTVFFSLVGVVLWGTLSGSMLPFALRKLGLDPASASAPFVATLVDVTGIVIYFNLGGLILKGALL